MNYAEYLCNFTARHPEYCPVTVPPAAFDPIGEQLTQPFKFGTLSSAALRKHLPEIVADFYARRVADADLAAIEAVTRVLKFITHRPRSDAPPAIVYDCEKRHASMGRKDEHFCYEETKAGVARLVWNSADFDGYPNTFYEAEHLWLYTPWETPSADHELAIHRWTGRGVWHDDPDRLFERREFFGLVPPEHHRKIEATKAYLGVFPAQESAFEQLTPTKYVVRQPILTVARLCERSPDEQVHAVGYTFHVNPIGGRVTSVLSYHTMAHPRLANMPPLRIAFAAHMKAYGGSDVGESH